MDLSLVDEKCGWLEYPPQMEFFVDGPAPEPNATTTPAIAAPVLSRFTFTDETSPMAVLNWWGDLVGAFQEAESNAAELLKTAEAIRAGKDSGLREAKRAAMAAARAAAEVAEQLRHQAETAFLEERNRFDVRLKAIFFEIEGPTPPAGWLEDFMEEFWECLERPMIEHWWDRSFRWIAEQLLAEPPVEDAAAIPVEVENAT